MRFAFGFAISSLIAIYSLFPSLSLSETVSAGGVEVQSDKFSDLITVSGVRLTTKVEGGHGKRYEHKTWLLRTWLDMKSPLRRHQLYFSVNYFGDWRHFFGASDDTANRLKFVGIDKEVLSCDSYGCFYIETFGVDIAETFLRSRIKDGFEVKTLAQDGTSTIFAVTAEQIGAQLAEVDRLSTTLPNPKASSK
jgi:hypothetical protein